MNILENNLTQILNEKTTKIIPENIKKGVTIFNIEGTLESGVDTSDADATTSDIAHYKTAYVNGQKITGTIAEYPYNNSINGGVVTDDVSSKDITIWNKNSDTDLLFDKILRGGAGLRASYSNVANAIGLTADKILKGNTILGIEGTVEAGSSTSGVKLFETKEAMQADTTAKEGNLAVVYRSDIKSVSNGDTITSITFPKTVVFTEAITSNYEGRLMNNSEPMIYLDIQLDASRFMLYDMNRTIQEIEYSSTDGITYTRTDSNEDTYEIGEATVEGLDEHICKFMQVGGNVFEGLFQYTNTVDGNTLKVYKDIHSTGSTITGAEYELDMRPYTSKIVELVGDTSSGSAKMVGIIGLNGHIYMVRTYADQYTLNAVYIANQLVLDIGQGSGTKAILQSLDGSENVTLELNTNSNIYRLYNGTKTYYYEGLDNIEFLGNVLVYKNALTSNASGFSAQTYLRDITNQTNTQTIISYISNTVTPIYKLTYVLAPTQLTSIADDVYKSMFYGKNGLETGTLTNNISNSFADTNAEVYSKIQNAYDNMEPRVLTDTDKTIDSNILFIPAKSDGTPMLDTSSMTNMRSLFAYHQKLTYVSSLNTSSVTNMAQMFDSCSNLKNVAPLDTSKVTAMYSMFNNCSNLISIPLLDTGNVTEMSNIFNHCNSLSKIPQLDTSKATNIAGMFDYCSSLKEIPQLDTSNATNAGAMFRNCTILETVPLMDISKVTNLVSMFEGCTSLSDESLNNILGMCTNATSYTDTKTLKYLGLTSDQANKCKTLSNYSAFTSAGWTTGY